jgi:predicted dehydrogenase
MGVAVLGGYEDMARARVTFANGCVADLSASRVHPAPVRRMQVWGAEGYAGVDFAKRHLTLMQPSEEVRHGGLDSRRLDASTAASLKAELFTRHVQVQEIDCAGGDQLTAELKDFLGSVRDKHAPRVDGTAGRDAVILATRVLEELRAHAWEGDSSTIAGPNNIPPMAGELFTPAQREAAA